MTRTLTSASSHHTPKEHPSSVFTNSIQVRPNNMNATHIRQYEVLGHLLEDGRGMTHITVRSPSWQCTESCPDASWRVSPC